MFEGDGSMQLSGQKSVIQKKLKVEVSARVTHAADLTIVDGCAMFWVLQWPWKGTVLDLINSAVKYNLNLMSKGDVCLVFDWYHVYSPKNCARVSRNRQASRQLHLHLSAPLPPQQVVLSVRENKKQLICLISSALIKEVSSRQQHGELRTELILLSGEPCPIEVDNGLPVERDDMRTTHQEADLISVYCSVLRAFC
jgi:hypothetical protein